MKCFIVLSALVAVALARPGHLLGYSHQVSHVAPLTYAAPYAYLHSAGAPIGHDGRVVDTPEVAHAKAEHAAAHAHALAQESSSYHSNIYASVPIATSSYHGAHAYHAAAPIGHDGRVVDTPEVAHAKAEHAAAHAHALAQESTSYHSDAYLGSYHAIQPVTYAKIVSAAPIGHDGRVVDTPEVAHAKAEHLAAHAHAKSALYSAPQVHLVSAYSSESYAPQYVSAHQW